MRLLESLSIGAFGAEVMHLIISASSCDQVGLFNAKLNF